MKLVIIADVSTGYGSRQITSIADYLGDYFNSDKTIIEPDQIEKPARHNLFPHIKFFRLKTHIHPHAPAGRIEYIINATKTVNQLKPEILVICTTFSLPVLFKLNYKPKKTIYYSLESIDHYVGDLPMNKCIDNLVDIIIFPEKNRAIRHLNLTKTKVPSCIVYNCVNDKNTDDIIPPDQRNGKIVYFGGIHKDTAYKYFLDKRLQKFQIDMFGLIEAYTSQEKSYITNQFLTLSDNVTYKGYLPYSELSKLKKFYKFSIVIWLPNTENTTWACPNKLFESIYHGIPPITSPQPQCKMICERYDCGIVMDDFSFDSFKKAIETALDMKKERYSELVENCKKAVNQELNWETQMKKVVRTLEGNKK